MLNGHLDTFPIGEARWSHPPLGADLEDGRIYGRGACDMKAGVAALVLATEPSWTDPEEEIVRAVCENAAAVTGRDVVVNLRAGFSDARFYRHAGVPSIV